MPNWLQNLDLNTVKAVLNLLISFSSGFLIGATEIISTFQYRRKLFKMPSVIIFLSFYGMLGVFAFILLTYQDPGYWGNTMAAFAAGISPHVVLRSRFSIIRSQDEKGEKKLDLSLDLEKVFNTWVKFFKNRIDVVYLQGQRELIDKLIQKYPKTDDMRREVSKMLYSLRAMEKEDRDAKLAEVEDIFQEAGDINDEICLHRMADLVVRMSDFDALKKDLDQEKKKLNPVESFLDTHPDFLNKIEKWKVLLTDKEQQYLEQKILSSNMTDKGKAGTAAKFLVSRKKLADVASIL